MIQVKAQEIDIQRQQRWLYNKAIFSLNGSPMWAIKGRNGSGKSTLLQLLIGYIEPTWVSPWSIDKKRLIEWISASILHTLAPPWSYPCI